MNILIVEDHPIAAMGLELALAEIFEEPTINHATTGAAALAHMALTQYDLITLDVVIPETDAHVLLCDIQLLQPFCKTLVYTNSRDDFHALRFIALGASGYLNKKSSKEDFKLAVQMVMNNEVFLSRALLANLSGRKRTTKNNPIDKLSKREVDWFLQLLRGTSSKNSGEILPAKVGKEREME